MGRFDPMNELGMPVRIALLLALGLIGVVSAGEPEVDIVRLHNGGVLHGRILEQDARRIVLEVGAGKISLPRDTVARIERANAPRNAEEAPVARRDEWFLLLRGERIVGWRRLVHTATDKRVQVEERQVILRPAEGAEPLDCRRVEIAALDGTPIEFLLMKTVGEVSEVVSGRTAKGELLVQIWRDKRSKRIPVPLEGDWKLELPRWSAFQLGAAAGQKASYRVLDPVALQLVDLEMERKADANFPTLSGSKRCRQLERRIRGETLRTMFRPSEGVIALAWATDELRAMRVHRERVELLQRAFQPEQPLSLEESFRYPYVDRPPDLARYHVRTGLALRLPDENWIEERKEGPEGLVLSYENDSLLASIDIVVRPLPSAVATIEDCFERGRMRLETVTNSIEPEAPPTRGRLSGWPARFQRFSATHRGEKLGCMLVVARAPDRYVVLVGASPAKLFDRTLVDIDRLLETLEITR